MFSTTDSEENTQVTSSETSLKSPSRDVAQSPETPEKSYYNRRELTFKMLLKEMFFCIALALTTYGALHSSPSKVSKTPQASRFFKHGSLVRDWYKGQLVEALTEINHADISFVMYYAPWDAECQHVRHEFEKAARVLRDRVHFSAINCWNPGSECRLQHHKIPSWPVIMAYTVTSRGVLYKGPRDAHSMVNFLQLVMRPLKRVSCLEDLVNLLSVCDAVAVGYTPLVDSPKYYNIWYNVALKIKEFDTLGEMCFGVVTSEELAADLGVEAVPTARLMTWNDTKEFEGDAGAWNESSLMSWSLAQFSQPVARVVPLWKKAFSFERYADGSPLLVLFTPLNPLYEQLPNYALMREVAMEYYNCQNKENNQINAELIKLQQVQRLLYQQRNIKKFCQTYKFKKLPKNPSQFNKKEVLLQYNKYPWYNATNKSQKTSFFNFLIKRGLDISKAVESIDVDAGLLSTLGHIDECDSTMLPAERDFYNKYEKCEQFEETLQQDQTFAFEGIGQTTMLPLEDDPLSPENLIQGNVQHYCKMYRFAGSLGPPVFPAKDEGNVSAIGGLACTTNRTLHMIAVDSVRNYHFAESLGVDIVNKKDMTAVVILDSKRESQYVLSEEFSAKSIRDFIRDFTHARLRRSLRSLVPDALHTHYYDAASSPRDNGTVHIVDLTTRSFRRLLRKPEQLTILAVCGGSCSSALSRSLLSASRLLRSCGVANMVTRVDAVRHDLPAHYTVPSYPAVFVIHDSEGGSDSVSYPSGQRVTSGGLVALALKSLGVPQHMRVRLALCQRAEVNAAKSSCLRDVKEHLSTLLAQNLKYYRRTEDEELKNALLQRLKSLHQVHFHLSLLHESDLHDNNPKQEVIFSSLSALAKHWEINHSILRKNSTIEGKR